ncbi:hypothetical protein GCM10027064_17330 [Microbacterium petrolearium]
MIQPRPERTSDTGWHIDPDTLLPVIDDLAVFREAHADDPAREALVSLWSGDPAEAERRIRADVADAGSRRARALLADCAGDQGRHADAIRMYDGLVAETVGTPQEAVMRQHLGKAHFVAGDLAAALREFTLALELRKRAGAPAELIGSSQLAVDRAAELLRGSTPASN